MAVVTLNRPDRGNAVNARMREDFTAAVRALNRDAGVRALVLTGAGRVFCSGQDFAESGALRLDQMRAWLEPQWAMYQAVRDLDKGIVCAWNGAAIGIGFQLGLLCDVRVASPEVRVGQTEVRFGLASILGSWLMSLHIGHGQNVELSLTGALVDGGRARELGLLNHLVEPDQVLPRAREVAVTLAAIPATAMRLTKARFRHLTQPGFDDACNAVVAAHLEDYATGEPQACMARFIEERQRRRGPAPDASTKET
ncbi:MAG TPA: enoyl-CoA hydratase/isomerase family protein [Ramlibacter sp.]|nr:enoyl-CoA hydratase/isomerase family protein [Ramlibacter sp.]